MLVPHGCFDATSLLIIQRQRCSQEQAGLGFSTCPVIDMSPGRSDALTGSPWGCLGFAVNLAKAASRVTVAAWYPTVAGAWLDCRAGRYSSWIMSCAYTKHAIGRVSIPVLDQLLHFRPPLYTATSIRPDDGHVVDGYLLCIFV